MHAPADVAAAITKVREDNLTYLTERCLRDLFDAVRQADNDELPGLVIEAGTALDDSAIVMALAKAPEREMRAYDAFDMIPPPSDKDGEDAHKRYKKIASGQSKGIGGVQYYGYRDDLLGEVTASFERFGVPIERDNVQLIKGYDRVTHTYGPRRLIQSDSHRRRFFIRTPVQIFARSKLQ